MVAMQLKLCASQNLAFGDSTGYTRRVAVAREVEAQLRLKSAIIL